MDILKQLNDALHYIEDHLTGEIDLNKVGEIACVSKDSFDRFFSYMTGMTLKEYIRRRRLTMAAYDLQDGQDKVIDTAIKYGWDSADAFTKAFVRQHGIIPSKARDPYAALKLYPPASFYIMIKGAQKMDFRIIQLEKTEVYGVSRQFEGMGYQSNEELRHIMWADSCDDVPGQICKGHWNEAGSHSMDGVWFGIWQDGKYMIARGKEDIMKNALEKYMIPAGTYATFRTECGGLAWEEFPRLRELIFHSWLPDSVYRQKEDIVIEVLHLDTDQDIRKKNRYYEIWIPVEKNK